MKSVLSVLVVTLLFSFAVNAQSKENTTDKMKMTKIEKVKTTELKPGDVKTTMEKVTVEEKKNMDKETMKEDSGKKEECGTTSSCCGDKKDKKSEKDKMKKQ